MSTPEEQMAAAIQQLNARLQQQETALTILTSGRESLARQVQSLTGTPGQRGWAGAVDTRVIGKTDQFDGDPMKYADWSFKLRSYFGAVEQRHQQELTTTEASSTPRLNATLDSEGSALSTQMHCILVMTTAGAALDMCHNAGVNEGFEAWRQFVMEWEPKLRTRYVGLLMNVLGYRFRDDIPTKLAAFEGTVHHFENQSTKSVEDDIKKGVTTLEMEDMPSETASGSQAGHRCEKRFSRSREHKQCIDSQPMPMQLGANPKSKGKGKDKGKDVKGKGKGKDAQNESSKKAKNDDQRKCFYCQRQAT